MALTVRIRGDASQFDKTMRGVKGTIGGLSSKIAGIGAAALGAATAYMTLSSAFEAVKSASEKASAIESLTMQFETLLGSASAAQKRMKEIARFAASTPFEIAELSSTSKLLQTMGGSLLATGGGLRMVGDAAAISGQPLQEVGLHIGRLFNAITSGTSAGESVARLQELGLMTGTVKREFEALAVAQKKGTAPVMEQAKALAMLKTVFASTEGAMARLAMTTEGKLSNMKDNIDQLQVAFGTGFNEGLKDALDATNTQLPQLEERFAQAGDFVGQAITESLTGNSDKFAMIGELLGDMLVAGMKASLITGLDNLGDLLGRGLASTVENISPVSFINQDLANTVGSKVRNITSSGTNFREQFSNARESSGLNASIDAIKTQMAIEKGIKTGIDSSMSQAVREGVLEAWARQPQGAKFSN